MRLVPLSSLFGSRGSKPTKSKIEQEVDLTNYYTTLNQKELDLLCDGRWINLATRSGDIKGKLKAQTFREVDGYSFVYQQGDIIAEIHFIRPAEKEHEFADLKLHLASENRYFIGSKNAGWLTSFSRPGGLFSSGYSENLRYLQQESLVLN